MKRFFLTIIAALLISVLGPVSVSVSAQDYYPVACSAFEVSYINDDGSLSKVACYNDFDSAKARMKELGGDHVVRNGNSWSPTKIIAMNAGMAYTYPSRNGIKGQTMTLFENAHKKTTNDYKTTYLTNHYEMTYIDTVEIIGGGTGMIHIVMNGFDGYTDLEYTDLVPMKYIRKSIPVMLGGKLNGPSVTDGEYPFKVICRQDYYEVVEKDGYRDLVFHLYRSYSNKSDYSPVSSALTIGKAPDFMEKGKRYYSNDGIRFYKDDLLTDFAGYDLNYYQFLPFRSRTDISAAQLNKFLVHKGHNSGSALYNQAQCFIDGQEMYGTNALLVYAMAIHESGYGESYLSLNYNNIFGWGAFDSNVSLAKKYPSIRDGVLAQMGDNLANYLDQSYRYHFGSCVGNKATGFNVKYASDPYWGVKIAGIAYEIDKYVSGNNGKYTDYDKYSVALVKSFNASVKAEPSSSSKTYYKTALSATYQPDITVIALENVDSYTKIQCTNPIVNGELVHPTQISTYADYNFRNSVAYIRTDDLMFMNGDEIDSTVTVTPEPETRIIASLDSLEFGDESFRVNGMAIALGHDHTGDKVRHDIEIVDLKTSEVIATVEARTASVPALSFNDSHTYENVMFEADVPYESLNNGEYGLNVVIRVDNKAYTKRLASTEESLSLVRYETASRVFTASCNELYSYLFTVRSEARETALSAVKKPSSRMSLLSVDELAIDDDNVLTLSGQGMIFYLDYDKAAEISYRLFLVSDKDVYIIDGEVKETPEIIRNILKSSRNCDNIDFAFSKDLDELNIEKGVYDLYLEIGNGDYLDYVEFNNYASAEYESNDRYSLNTGAIRDRICLEVK